jgi:predicted component of type VI protein secretion system
LRVLYLSHNGDRHQSLYVHDRELHGKLTLPKQELVSREFELRPDDVRDLSPDARETKILVEEFRVDTAKPWKVFLPVNGGFGVKFEGSARTP